MRGATDAASVAAVISVYNESEDALERTLESILAQSG
jgi:glycosyltransferase involved in cell wall biosynthesis